jgi:hypothetical protein
MPDHEDSTSSRCAGFVQSPRAIIKQAFIKELVSQSSAGKSINCPSKRIVRVQFVTCSQAPVNPVLQYIGFIISCPEFECATHLIGQWVRIDHLQFTRCSRRRSRSSKANILREISQPMLKMNEHSIGLAWFEVALMSIPCDSIAHV